jgi:methylenetetrahydrofolate reductase (NADPH)
MTASARATRTHGNAADHHSHGRRRAFGDHRAFRDHVNLHEHGKTRAVVAGLVSSADIEIIPLRSVIDTLSAVSAGTTITITCSPKLGLERTLEFTELAARAGHRVIPHLAARQVTDEACLRSFVRRLDQSGVTDLYVIGGDVREPAGIFSSAAELLETLAGIGHGIKNIGTACYPEGHPDIPDEILLEELRRKQPYVTYMVNQLCFDGGVLVGWLRQLRTAGIQLPLHLGLAAPLNTRKLAQLSLKIGVGSSMRYLAKQHGLAGTLLRGSSYRPEKLLLEIAATPGYDELGIESVHLFSFNQITTTVDWQRRRGEEWPRVQRNP